MSNLLSRLAGFLFACAAVTTVHAAPDVITEEVKFGGAGVGSEHSGTAVSISGDTAVMGAPQEGSSQGAAYVFFRDNGTWVLQQRLDASDGVTGDLFGHSVSISGDHIAIGAAGRNSGRGAVYTFARSAGVWTQGAPLAASDGLPGDQLGFSVSLQGLTLVAGAPLDDVSGKTDTGSAYVFTNDGLVWTQAFHIQITQGQIKAQDHLGWSVALSGNTVLAGAPDDDFGNKTDAGSVYVFVRSGNRWTRQARINPGAVSGDRTGSAVALFSNTALIGSDGADVGANGNQGKAFVYNRSGTTWTLATTLTASDGAANDRFGASVALSGPLAVVGAPFADPPAGTDAGEAYLFGDAGGGLAQIDTLVASDTAAGDGFGSSAALDAGRAMVGAPRADAPGVDSGAAYAFLVVQPSTTSIGTITPEPSLTGQSYLVPVTVLAPAGIPSGTVDVSDGDAATCTITLDANGMGSCSLTSIAAFLHTVSASYNGTIVFGGSTDDQSHLVNKADTTVAISSDLPDPSLVGEPVTVAVAVSVTAPGTGTPTGLVDIVEGTTTLCTIDLSVGSTCTVAFGTVGTHMIFANYAGDDDFNGSDSSGAPTSHTVSQSQTTTALTAAPEPSVVGQSVTLTATVSVTAPGAGPPGGAVLSGTADFFNGATLLGSSSLGAGGVATLSTSFATSGTFQLHAVYNGDTNYAGSTSVDYPHVVGAVATTTTIASDLPDPSGQGQAYAVVVSVTSQFGATPTGTVVVDDGLGQTCNITLAAGAGSCNISSTTLGALTLTATFTSDVPADFQGSSDTESHDVNTPVVGIFADGFE